MKLFLTAVLSMTMFLATANTNDASAHIRVLKKVRHNVSSRVDRRQGRRSNRKSARQAYRKSQWQGSSRAKLIARPKASCSGCDSCKKGSRVIEKSSSSFKIEISPPVKTISEVTIRVIRKSENLYVHSS